MNLRTTIVLGLLITILTTTAFPAEAGVTKAAARGAAKSVKRAIERRAARNLRRDFMRDSATKLRPLKRGRSVFRYTTKRRGALEARKGIAASRHMTSLARPGKPLSGLNAQRRYGLPHKPSVRLTIKLGRGMPVRHNRVIGGRPGLGEVTSSKRVSPTAIKRTVRLK